MAQDPVLLCRLGLQHYATGDAALRWFHRRGYVVFKPRDAEELEEEEEQLVVAAVAACVALRRMRKRKLEMLQLVLVKKRRISDCCLHYYECWI